MKNSVLTFFKKKLFWYSTTLTIAATSIIVPLSINYNIKLNNDKKTEKNFFNLNLKDIELKEINANEISNQILTVYNREISKIEDFKKVNYNESDKDFATRKTAYVNNENEIFDLLKKTTNAAKNYIAANGLTQYFWQKFLPDLKMDEIDKASKNIYQKKLSTFLKNNANVPLTNFASVKYNSSRNLSDLVKNLRISKKHLSGISAASAVAAAGYYVLAWSFPPFTLWAKPWAVASTVISVTTGAAAAGVSIALLKYDNEIPKIAAAGNALSAILQLGNAIYKIVYAVLVTAKATLTVSSWAFPAGFAIIGTIAFIIGSLNYYK